VARARGDADSIGSALRKAVYDVDPELGIVQLETMDGMVSDSLWSERFSALGQGPPTRVRSRRSLRFLLE
jgi:hypothetical protein